MSIKIGDNNKIKKSNIIDYNNSTVSSKDTPKESFANRHPILIGIGCSIIAVGRLHDGCDASVLCDRNWMFYNSKYNNDVWILGQNFRVY